MRLPEVLEEKVNLYRSMEEGEVLWEILEKINKECSNWMNGFKWYKMKCELFVQIVELYHSEEQ